MSDKEYINDGLKWGSKELVGRSQERFKELEDKQWDWRSFYNGWLEGRGDMLSKIKGFGPYNEHRVFISILRWLHKQNISFNKEGYYDSKSGEEITFDQLYDIFKLSKE